jgi:hypothetical protein
VLSTAAASIVRRQRDRGSSAAARLCSLPAVVAAGARWGRGTREANCPSNYSENSASAEFQPVASHGEIVQPQQELPD